MDKQDIRNVRKWHRDAAIRAKRAGYDIINIYAAHWYLIVQFLLPSNQRTDEYGGSLENRARLLKELIIETKEAVGDTCAVAVRFSASFGASEHAPENPEPREVIELLSELPDLWDIVAHNYTYEMGTSRFVPEAALESAMSWVKSVTTKPVVSVGRFTSPDTMLRLVQQGVVDLVGAARPSISDPFLPKKIDEGREDEIRECIGCNICYVGDQTGTPLTCTQNPTIGEEWRKGWHPEYIPPKGSDSSVLIVGGGPAGLEAAVALGKRGYAVTLAEARHELGGRVTLESELPGLREWIRVLEWRLNQISKLRNVEYHLDSDVDKEQILEFAADRTVIATGAKWRRDGIGRWDEQAIPGWQEPMVMTPDDIFGGAIPEGPVVLYDDDYYYIGGVIAEKLRGDGLEVTLVTPANEVSTWTRYTEEQHRIQERILTLGIHLRTGTSLSEIQSGGVVAECIYTGRKEEIPASAVVLVTSREPYDDLYHSLRDEIHIDRIGDCLAPGTIATSVYSGHRYAREMDADPPEGLPFKRER
jgi:dimethylamine/trimethylamine dehydrogenase